MKTGAMKRKNAKVVRLPPVQMVILWVLLLGLTLLRFSVATGGALNQGEAFLSVCALHPAGGYVEGPAGTPLLLALLYAFGVTGLSLRGIAPLFALLLSWSVWLISRRVDPHRHAVAFWSVLGVNLLPSVNLSSLTMDGAMITGSMILLSVAAGWNAVESWENNPLKAWALFGAALAIGTLFYQPVGWLLPIAVILLLMNHGIKGIPWHALLASMALLLLGWILPVAWNARHDWIQWSSIAPGFDTIHLGNLSCPLGLLVAASSVAVPFLVLLACSGGWWRMMILFLALACCGASSLILLLPASMPAGLPSPVGVQGTGNLARMVISLREARPDPQGKKSFLIASTPGLAALFGEKIRVVYPERPGAPSVFVAESPSLNSSYSLWPGYADAVAAGTKDPFYTEEKSVSPFLGRNALYITTESKEELPQTITGAFGAVGLLKEVPLSWNGHQVIVRIYQCEGYRTLAL